MTDFKEEAKEAIAKAAAYKFDRFIETCYFQRLRNHDLITGDGPEYKDIGSDDLKECYITLLEALQKTVEKEIGSAKNLTTN
jgi:cystathionine beta-lyase family protein involved in aluminum resistance